MNLLSDTDDLIITYNGRAALATEVKTQNGKTYPYRYQAVTPEDKGWDFRILDAMAPTQIGPGGVAELFKKHGPVLRANWERVIGHPVGTVTFYVPDKSGRTSKQTAVSDEMPDMRPTIRPQNLQLPELMF